MEMLLKVNKKILLVFFVFNFILLMVLFLIPIEKASNLCLYKMISGKECWNCGMTRAFLAVIHFKFKEAINYNKNVIIVFPLAVILYVNTWIKKIYKGGSI